MNRGIKSAAGTDHKVERAEIGRVGSTFALQQTGLLRPGWPLWVFLILLLWVVARGVVPAFRAPIGDFANYHTSARVLLSGESLDRAYWDFTWFQKQIDRTGVTGQLGGFIPQPPTTALLMVPLAPLEPSVARNLWTVINILLAVACAGLLARISSLPLLLAAGILLSTGGALINNLLFGQVYLLALFLVLLGLYFDRRGLPLASGFCFGGLAAIKYLGLAWLVYYLWKGKYRIVAGGIAALLAAVLAVLFLDGTHSFQSYAHDVFPRLLAGEIQDPYSTRWQSWNSLLRRLFLYERTLNPKPALDSPLLYFLARNVVVWTIAAASIAVIVLEERLGKQRRDFLQLGLIPISLLLISPGGATYHVLLLAVPAALFTRILLDDGRRCAALLLWGLLLAINLPHHLWLEPLAEGWSTPFVYSRLGLLMLYFVISLGLFWDRGWISFPRVWLLLFLLVPGIAGLQFLHWQQQTHDGAQWLAPRGPEFDRELGLLLDAPNTGSRKTVFSYGELLSNSYSIYAIDGKRWTPPSARNYYDPDLGRDDLSLLVESVGVQGSRIDLSRLRGDTPSPLVSGSHPSWSPDGRRFAFLRERRACIATLPDLEVEQLPLSHEAFDIVWSPAGDEIAYCSREAGSFKLVAFHLSLRKDFVLLDSAARIEDVEWSPDGSFILFSWGIQGHQDIWALKRRDGQLVQLTADRGNDENPIWDDVNHRVIFVSDRGRGLQYGTLYWISIPERLRE